MDNKNDKDNKNKITIQNLIIISIAVLLAFIVTNFLWRNIEAKNTVNVSYTDFMQFIEDKNIDEVYIGDSSINFKILKKTEQYDEKLKYRVTKVDVDNSLIDRLYESGAKVFRIRNSSSYLAFNILSNIIFIVVFFLFMSAGMRRYMPGQGIGQKSNAKLYIEKDTGVSFNDVAGEDEAKEMLTELVDFLHNPKKFTDIGARLPKGALLVGPPGTGKTLLAKAVAGEAKVPFFSITGSDFVEMYVGLGASRVRDLFEKAKKMSPCIIFIDEIDAIGKSRDNGMYGGNDEREQTLNQILSEMDGFDSEHNILVIGATNRPEILDKALLRPGRFDRRVIVEEPDLKGRIAILEVHAKKVKLDETVDFNEVALATSGAVGADLANMINEAAIIAVKHNRKAISQADLLEAVEVVLVGKEKKDRVLNKKERKIVAYHEIGHALISALQKHSEPIQKITIIPRTMGTLGYVMYVPEEETYLQNQKELEERLVSIFGGRAAEEVKFEDVTTGAHNDIEKATDIARSMVTQFGMSKRFGLMNLEKNQNRYLSDQRVLNCADKTAAEVDDEVRLILKNAYNEAVRILRENEEALDKLAQYLLDRDTITGKEFMQILRETKAFDDDEKHEAMEEAESSNDNKADICEDNIEEKAEV